MIARLRGSVVGREDDAVILEAAGVGYRVFVSLPTLGRLAATNGEVLLHVHTCVREDAFHLYGFETPDEKRVFKRLIQISGIGPKTALAMLSGMEPDVMEQAIAQGDVARLTRVPGIGKKTAERIIVELRDVFVQMPAGRLLPTLAAVGRDTFSDLASALQNLGYKRQKVDRVLQKLRQRGGERTFEELIRDALKEI